MEPMIEVVRLCFRGSDAVVGLDLDSVALTCYIALMATTTVRLDDDDEALLDLLAPEFGGRSSALRHALRALAAQRKRQRDLRSFLAEWDLHGEPPDEEEVTAMARRYGL